MRKHLLTHTILPGAFLAAYAYIITFLFLGVV